MSELVNKIQFYLTKITQNKENSRFLIVLMDFLTFPMRLKTLFSEIIKRPKQDQKIFYDDKIKELLKCNICLDISNDAISTSCGHVYCYSCFKNCIQKNNICPVCRKETDEYRFIPIFQRNKTIKIRNEKMMNNVEFAALVMKFEELVKTSAEKRVEKSGYFQLKQSTTKFNFLRYFGKKFMLSAVVVGFFGFLYTVYRK